MSLSFILLIIFFSYLRKNLDTKKRDPKLDKQLLSGVVLAVSLLVLQLSYPASAKITIWICYILFLGLVYLCVNNESFKTARPFSYALLPFLIVSIAEELTKLISPRFYRDWDKVFDIADTFAIIWMIAMLYINRKQRRALELERQKAEQREKEFELTQRIKDQLEVQVAERTSALELQKASLEQTLAELKATQGQLIQSEKMASLGELTAGIAHEIQNPLNFVNNFSEVSNELIGEMMDELQKGNTGEVKLIAADVKQNLEKILHHGKRADSIVKGMLQHSRSSNGVKEPVDINALADEYFRLAYHGLRAKDKSFNAAIKTDFDTSIEKINIIPQDIGRVMLNLLTNAFYAVTEKKNALSPAEQKNYEPTVILSTKNMGNEIAISIKDNGNGIPESVRDKIFQPFFTTKPTGKGTGLGLSMSYEIVTNAHKGQLLVKTEEKTGTEFIIKLPK